jgi:hypothetical protein
MRLLHIDDEGEICLTEFIGNNIPPYAILSHTWGPDHEEITYRDVIDAATNPGYQRKEGYRKLEFCIKQAILHNLHYVWIDTCCIDKSSSAELSEAINSMFRWYQNADRCYVFLTDIWAYVPGKPQSLKASRWFTRGWTLQELLAPESVEFFTCNGVYLGELASLTVPVQQITGIPKDVLRRSRPLTDYSVESRLSWAEGRETKREEDAAYSLLGLFDVHIPLIYGEGRNKAMNRLRKEIAESMKEEQFSPGMPGLPTLVPAVSMADAPPLNRALSQPIRAPVTEGFMREYYENLRLATDSQHV